MESIAILSPGKRDIMRSGRKARNARSALIEDKDDPPEAKTPISNDMIDTDAMSAGKLGVRGIPALFLYHNGKVVDQKTGMQPKPALDAWLNDQMGLDF